MKLEVDRGEMDINKAFWADCVIGKNNTYKMGSVFKNPILKALSYDQLEKPHMSYQRRKSEKN